MLRDTLAGVAAGAAGTVALDVATYADMAIRGRPSSEVPTKVAGALTQRLGISLFGDGPAASDDAASNRRSAIGSLMGYVTGVGLGALVGALRPRLGRVSVPLAGVA